MSSRSLVGDAKHFQEGRAKFDQLRTLLESKNEKEKLEAMKTIIAVMCLSFCFPCVFFLFEVNHYLFGYFFSLFCFGFLYVATHKFVSHVLFFNFTQNRHFFFACTECGNKTQTMTLGRDVSPFFPHVVKNVVVESMEVKKLVYMYVIHYASTNGDLALLSISSFQKGKVFSLLYFLCVLELRICEKKKFFF